MPVLNKREVTVGTLEVLGVSFEKVVRVNRRCTRSNLRLDPLNKKIIVTSPRLLSLADAKRFIADYMPWIEGRVQDRSLERTPFAHGAILTLLGRPYRLVRLASTSTLENAAIETEEGEDLGLLPFLVTEDKFPEAVVRYLKSYARDVLTAMCHEYAKKHEVEVTQVRIKDTRTRWGSCNENGVICLSWRLLFAPREVAAYVCAHEVSHLKEMNHSQRFWQHVKAILPDYEIHKEWLRVHGKNLYYYG